MNLLDLSHYFFNPYSIPPFLTAFAVLGVGLAVVLRERLSRISTKYLVMSGMAFVWLFAYSLMYSSKDMATATQWGLTGDLGVCLLSAAIYDFTVSFLQIGARWRFFSTINWLFSAFFFGATFFIPNNLLGLYHYSWGWYPRYAGLRSFFVAYFFCLLALSFTHYFREYRREFRIVPKRRIRTFMLAFLVGYFAMFDFLPNYGTSYYPLGFVFVLVFLLMVGQVIWRYQLVDLTPAFAADQILETMEGAVFVVDPEGLICFYNRAAQEMLTCQEKDLLARPITQFLDSVDVGRAGPHGILERGAFRNEDMTWRTPRNLRLDVSVSTSVLRDKYGEPIGIIYTARDIAERKRYEAQLERAHLALEDRVVERTQALQESEMRYRSVIRSLAEGIFVANSDCIVIATNRSAERILGIPEKELIGRSLVSPSWVTVYEDGRPCLPEERPTYRTIRTGRPTLKQVMGVHKPDGTLVWIEVNTQPLFHGQEQRPFAAVASFTDVTERKRAEAERFRFNIELEQQVQQRTAELSSANRELEAFSYSISHDLRAPLRAIESFAKILEEDYGVTIDAEGRRLLQIIQKNTRRMDDLIKDLLEFSKVSRRNVERHRIDMKEMAYAVADELQSARPKGNLRVRVTPMPPAQGDAPMVRQALFNLLSNAIKFSHTKPHPEVEIGCISHPPEPVFYVRDNGVGFDMKYANKLFGVFQRLHNDEAFEGTGVGLAIVQRIVHRHGGRIWAEAKVDEGATFYFTLPSEA